MPVLSKPQEAIAYLPWPAQSSTAYVCLIAQPAQGSARRSIKQVAPDRARATYEIGLTRRNRLHSYQVPHTKRPAQSNFTNENFVD